jgi:hypothetical protein
MSYSDRPSFRFAPHDQSEALSKARALVLERYNKFKLAEKPYFQIDLTDYSAEIRITVITEIGQRFKGIGYREPPPPSSERKLIYDGLLKIIMESDERTRPYANIINPKPVEQKCRVVRLATPEQAGNFTHFFIAMTEQANQQLETYTWLIK